MKLNSALALGNSESVSFPQQHAVIFAATQWIKFAK